MTRKQIYITILICVLATLPFLIPSFFGAIKNQNAFALFAPFFLGMPWSVLLGYIPFDIQGFNTPGIPNAQGDIILTPPDVMLVMIPFYINVFIVSFVIGQLKKRLV